MNAAIDTQQLKSLSKDEIIDHFQQRLSHLEAMVEIFKRKQFAPSSEKFEGQTALFNEPEASEADRTPLPSSKIGGYTRRRGKRKPLPEHLPRVEKIYELEKTKFVKQLPKMTNMNRHKS